MTRSTGRYPCAEEGCIERAFFDYDTRRDQQEHAIRLQKHPWRCTRHTRPDEVLSDQNPRRETVVIADRSKRFPDLTKLFWREEQAADVGSGFIFGPGFKAYADDFPQGTRLRITVEVERP